MSQLNNVQKQRVKELRRDPVFAEICRKIVEDHGGVPTYKPKKAESRGQEDEWKYRSGIADGIELVLKTLGYDEF